MKLSNEEILINARERIGLSCKDMAKRLAIPVSQVKAWEDGSEIINTTDIIIITRAYELELMEMIFYLENIKVHSIVPYIKPGGSSNIN